MEKITGLSLFELTSEIHKIMEKNSKKYGNMGRLILGSCIRCSLNALKEFRSISKEIPLNYETYPYSENLVSALNEISTYLSVISHEIMEEAIIDIRSLAECLEKDICVPFRDAHLKNRLLKWERKKYLFNWYEIPGKDTEKLIEILLDIGFEWVKTSDIQKDDNGKVIKVFNEQNFVLLRINDEKTHVNLTVDEDTTYEFISIMEKGELSIYRNMSITEIAYSLLNMKPEELFRVIAQNVYDIDFESAYYKVTFWDDIVHILFFENVGLISLNYNQDMKIAGNEFIDVVIKWTDIEINDKEKDIFWKTVLARSIREFCRRIWYANVMPETYYRRYQLEGRDYYLKLAIFASVQTNSFISLQNFLKLCEKNRDTLWAKVPQRHSIKYLHPLYLSENEKQFKFGEM